MSRRKPNTERLDCGCVLMTDQGRESITLCRGHTLEWTIRHLAAIKSASHVERAKTDKGGE
jgi:hypothetical protein